MPDCQCKRCPRCWGTGVVFQDELCAQCDGRGTTPGCDNCEKSDESEEAADV